MTDRELMQMALDTLESKGRSFRDIEAIKALRERLSQPEPAPVAWREVAGKTTRYYDYNESGHGEPLYLSQVHEHPLDQLRQKDKDITELTHACQLLFRRNQELLDALRRSEETRNRVDQGSRRKS